MRWTQQILDTYFSNQSLCSTTEQSSYTTLLNLNWSIVMQPCKIKWNPEFLCTFTIHMNHSRKS